MSLIFNLIFVLGGTAYAIKKFNTTSKIDVIYATHYHRTSLFKLLPIKKDNIVFVGDSITQRCEWDELFNNSSIRNRGIDYDTTGNILSRIGEITKGKPEKIFIMAGINDLQRGVSKDKLLSNYKYILSIIKDKSPNTKVFVQSILPVNTDTNTSFIFTNNDIKNVNSQLQKIAGGFGYKYINLYKVFADNKNQLKPYLTKDGIHLAGEGYLLWKKAIINYVNQ
nr:GDSL-type esterase/lipase family protein [Sporolactobacillus kofuensis]